MTSILSLQKSWPYPGRAKATRDMPSAFLFLEKNKKTTLSQYRLALPNKSFLPAVTKALRLRCFYIEKTLVGKGQVVMIESAL